ncbi:MAG TPA: cytochrome c oxidase subunit II [Stellaceae bacterium]|nr:cytochrome c oxidase subunit II [Stellaceae bacterium]
MVKFGTIGAALATLTALPALAADELPQDWQIGMQKAATPVREHIDSLHGELIVIITLITLFVLGLLLYVIVRFNARRNPTPSTRTHNSVLELIWTAVPVLILLSIAIPSFKLMYYMDRTPKPDMTLKVTGHQWYWSYEYPDSKLSFDSNILSDDKAKAEGKPRLLAVDNPVVVPVGATIRVLVTSTDVIHSWFMPAFGVQEYAVIGRTNYAWMKIDRPGTYYGECNQICGNNHPFMPIEVRAVSKEEFATWLADAKKKFAHDGGTATAVRYAERTAQ